MLRSTASVGAVGAHGKRPSDRRQIGVGVHSQYLMVIDLSSVAKKNKHSHQIFEQR